MLLYKDHNERLMKNVVLPGNVGGWLVQDGEKETLYAVSHSGLIRARTINRNIINPPFNGSGWRPVDSVPENAEWIGQYTI